jgi:GMP synthase PP-ATPase subunit
MQWHHRQDLSSVRCIGVMGDEAEIKWYIIVHSVSDSEETSNDSAFG